MLLSVRFRSALCALAVAPACMLAQAAKPGRIAIGMVQSLQMPSATVEITTDGWVRLDIIATYVADGVQAPSMRLLAEPRDVRAWAARVRTMLKTRWDSSTAPVPILLGNGNFQLSASHSYNTTRDEVHFSWRGCGPGFGGSSPTRADLARLVDLLDSAAVEAGGGFARPPTLKEPYSASEVSCPPRGEPSHWLPFPANASARERVPTEVGVRFVVDTAGQIEDGSMRFLDGTPGVFSRAAADAIRTWRYRAAEVDGTPVRQVVHTTLIFSNVLPKAVDRDERTFIPQADGWVRVEHRPGSFERAADMEWFAPDSIDAFVRRVPRLRVELDSARKYQRAEIDSMRKSLQSQSDSINRVLARFDSAQRPANVVRDSTRVRTNLDYTVRRVPVTGNLSTALGDRRGRRLIVTEHATATGSRQGTSFTGCGGPGGGDGLAMTEAQFNQLAAAAREARARRATPDEPGAHIRTAPDVACPAWLIWNPTPRAGFATVWRYPTAIYPESMAATNERADVLVSVVVDTAGVPDPETAIVMGNSNPRAVAALPATLRALRFTPARRSGVPVAQRVIQTIRFEPPPQCAVPEASPACPRRYRDEP
jgi:outer membrane biosynthesis protein TonB